MSQSISHDDHVADAPVDVTFLTQTANGTLTAEQDLSTLVTGYRKNTTTTGAQTSQAVPIPTADGGSNKTSFTTNGVHYKDATQITTTLAGANNTVLHGNTGSAPTYSAVNLAADVGATVLPVANGGTNQSIAFTAGSAVFSDGTRLTQDNANFFWDNTDKTLILGGTSAGAGSIILDNSGTAVFNEKGNTFNVRIEGDTATNLFLSVGFNNGVDLGTTVQGDIAKFRSNTVIFNESGLNQDFRAESQTNPNMLFLDASADSVGIGTGAPHTTLHVDGGISVGIATKTADYTTLASDCAIIADAEPSAAGITITIGPIDQGKIITVKKTNVTTAKTVSVVSAGAGFTIEGSALPVVLAAQYSFVTLIMISIGVSTTNWAIIDQG